MGELVYRHDSKWDKPAITLPGAEKWHLIDRHIVSNGFCADLAGQQMFYLDVGNYWISLVSKTAALRVSQIVGNENASVNYIGSYEPYYPKLAKACGSNSATAVPVSTCIGTERLAIELYEDTKELRFSTVQPFPTLKKKPKVPAFIYGLCYQPCDHTDIPERFVMPGISRILDFIRPLFPDVRSMVTYMWLVGNAARDPVAKPRCMLLCGPGGSGKSTALRMATAALSGATNLIPDNILTKESEGIGDKVAQVVVKSRMVTCYELDLVNKNVNMSMFKNITGGDYVKVGEFMAKAVCSFAIATNGLPNMERQPEFASDALSRRLVCIKMDVDTADAPFEPDPSEPTHKMDFLCACLYIRMVHHHLPISPDDLLLTLCGSLYHTALTMVEECPNSQTDILDSRAVVARISGLLDTSPDILIGRCRLISITSVENTPLGYIIKGLRQKR